MSKLGSWGLLILCNLMWALQFVCIKLTQTQCGPYFTVWGPMLLALLFLIPFVLKDFKARAPRLKDFLVFGQLAILGAFPAQVLMTMGTQSSSASNAAILSLCLPVLTALFAFVLLGEKMNKVKWICFLLAVIGSILCSTSELAQLNFNSKYTIGNLLIFLAITGNAYYNVGIKKIAERYSEAEMVFYTYLIMVVLLTPLVLIFEPDVFRRIRWFPAEVWYGLGILAFFHNFLSMVLFFKALKQLDAIQVGVSNYLITFMALPIAAFLLQESITLISILGGALILGSSLIITVLEYRYRRSDRHV